MAVHADLGRYRPWSRSGRGSGPWVGARLSVCVMSVARRDVPIYEFATGAVHDLQTTRAQQAQHLQLEFLELPVLPLMPIQRAATHFPPDQTLVLKCPPTWRPSWPPSRAAIARTRPPQPAFGLSGASPTLACATST